MNMSGAGADAPSIFQKLRLMQECPLCGGQYPQSGVTIIEQRLEGSHLLHIQCAKCGTAILAVVLITQVGMSTVGMVTDLTVADIRRLHGRDAISADDILEFHQFMQNADGEKLLASSAKIEASGKPKN